jgi:CRP/FNR family transcriptional regulator, anaerobic regulatory protein
MSVAPVIPFTGTVARSSRILAPRRCEVASCVPRGRALFWQDEHQGQNIEIRQGAVRAVRLLENGNRQILAFFWPGDTIRAPHASCQHYTAEAVTTCWVTRSSAADEGCTEHSPCGSHQLLEELLTLIPMMGRKNSFACVAWLLLKVRPHLPCDPKRLNTYQLVIPRADIADHLGTSMETVCRALAEFKARGLIELPTRKTIRFLDDKGLAQVYEG